MNGNEPHQRVPYYISNQPYATGYSYPPYTSGVTPYGGQASAAAALPKAEPSDAASEGDLGQAMAIASAFTAVIGAIGQAMVERTGLKAQGDALKHQGFMANINARIAETGAQSVMQAAKGLFARLSSEYGQRKEQQKTGAANRGVEVNQGSSGNVLASTDAVKNVDKYTINKNAVAKAGAIRMGGVNQRSASLMANIGAGNLNRSAGDLSPVTAGMNAAMQGIGQYAWNKAGNYGYRRGNNAYRNTGVS